TAPAENYPVRSCTGDLNGDGKPDVAIPNAIDNTISIFRNTSTGGTLSFAAKTDIGIFDPSSVSMGDIDGDGKPDLVATISAGGSSSISIFRNTSTGTNITFAAAVSYGTGPTTYSTPHNSTIMDLDGDGRPDVAIVNGDGSMTVYRNTSSVGAISLGIKQNYTIGPNGQSICARDLDGDGKPDLVTANSGVDNSVSVFLNTSSIGNVAFTPALTLPNFAGPYGVTIGDMDGDGLADLAVVNANYVFDGTSYINTVSVLKNTSSTGLISFAPRQEFKTGSYPLDVSMGDLDGDGKPDLAIANGDGNTVSVLRNTGGSGTIAFDTKVDYATGARPVNISVIDMNADGRPDLVTANENAYALMVLTNQTSSTPIPVLTSFTPVTASQGNTVTIKGSHFTGTTTVSLGGLPASSFTVVSDTTITAIVGNGNTGAVNVITPGGSASLAGFTYIGLKITSFTPASAKEETAVTIKGTHFTGATGVSFGLTPAQSFTVISDTAITAVVGTGSTGAVAIAGPMGLDSLGGFTFIDTTASIDTTTSPPTSTVLHITSFTPAGAPPGATVIISGSHFTGATAVDFGRTPAASFTVVSDSTITAIVGNGSSGQVFVTGPAGLDSLAGFTFVNNPGGGGIDTTTPPPPAPPTFRLVSFTGTVSANQPVLSWQAADDPGIDYYVVEYSTDSTNFSAAGSVKAVGKDTSTVSYSYVDPAPRNLVIYYRLKIEDTAGKVTYSKVIAVRLTGFAPTLSVSPNPVNAYLTAIVPNAAVPSQFQLTDMMGQITRSVKVAANVTSVRIDVTNLTEGVYKLIWSDGVNYSYQTILILR
ncbi:MAG: FG-GAP-like repeat-containing protein, partial [Bacteroidota bacterium]